MWIPHTHPYIFDRTEEEQVRHRHCPGTRRVRGGAGASLGSKSSGSTSISDRRSRTSGVRRCAERRPPRSVRKPPGNGVRISGMLTWGEGWGSPTRTKSLRLPSGIRQASSGVHPDLKATVGPRSRDACSWGQRGILGDPSAVHQTRPRPSTSWWWTRG